LLGACRLSISQAGYNTTLEVLAAGVPAVLVPFAAGEEGEQSMRAKLLAERGLLTLVEEKGLTGARLAAGIERELQRPRPARGAELRLDGAAESAREVLSALAARECAR
jgi:predicted glycosyltransferase